MSEPLSVHIWSDYVCPWCYIGLVEVEKAAKPYDVKLEWEPFFLRPDAPEAGWDLPDHIKAKMNSPNNPLQARAKALGISLKEREHVPNSRRAHEATEFARENGKLDAFHASVLRRYWSEGADISKLEVLREAAVEAGLDADALQSALENGQYTQNVKDRVKEAYESGIHAVPSFVFAEKYLVQGAQEAKTFEQVLEQLKAPRKNT
jgi:predicted DsbA family dithiol-disulfide isomerase